MTRDIASIRAALVARLAELGARVDAIEEAQREPLDDDLSEQAVAREDDEALDGVERAAMEEIARIRGAIGRIEAGTLWAVPRVRRTCRRGSPRGPAHRDPLHLVRPRS